MKSQVRNRGDRQKQCATTIRCRSRFHRRHLATIHLFTITAIALLIIPLSSQYHAIAFA
ncbi:MAG: hypothetical protein KME30_22280 [Iphinoe sp. HA4291-MV1]|nr:hypothetical protein [Iphinoe sp. HA4291-MV1]